MIFCREAILNTLYKGWTVTLRKLIISKKNKKPHVMFLLNNCKGDHFFGFFVNSGYECEGNFSFSKTECCSLLIFSLNLSVDGPIGSTFYAKVF